MNPIQMIPTKQGSMKRKGMALITVASLFITIAITFPSIVMKMLVLSMIPILIILAMMIVIDLNLLSNDIKTELVRIDAASTMEKIENRKVIVVTWSCPECPYDLHVHYIKPGNGELQQFKEVVADHLVTCHYGEGSFPFFTIRMKSSA